MINQKYSLFNSKRIFNCCTGELRVHNLKILLTPYIAP